MFCKNCGKENGSGKKFCSNCGTSLDTPIKKLSEVPKLTKWDRFKYAIGSATLLILSIVWIVDISDSGTEDFWGMIWVIGLGLGGLALCARVFGRTPSGILKNFFQVKAVKTTGGILKKFLKFGFWLGLIIGGIWLIITLGPLWIIAIILLLILFVVANM